MFSICFHGAGYRLEDPGEPDNTKSESGWIDNVFFSQMKKVFLRYCDSQHSILCVCGWAHTSKITPDVIRLLLMSLG